MRPIIKHLVIAGGAHIGFSYYGAIRTLCKYDFIKMKHVETIYATSVGTILSVMLSLDLEWDDVDEYVAKQQWKKVFPFNIGSALKAIPKGGLYDMNNLEKVVSPLLEKKHLPCNITLQEFHDFNKKDIHFIATQYEPFQLKDISYKTHPEWPLLDAIYASSCFPVLFVPYETQTNIYLDGALYENYPINQCIANHDPNETFGISFEHYQTNHTSYKHSSFRLVLFLLDLMFKLWNQIKHPMTNAAKSAPYQINIRGDTRVSQALHVVSSEHERNKLIQNGVNSAHCFLSNLPQSPPLP